MRKKTERFIIWSAWGLFKIKKKFFSIHKKWREVVPMKPFVKDCAFLKDLKPIFCLSSFANQDVFIHKRLPETLFICSVPFYIWLQNSQWSGRNFFNQNSKQHEKINFNIQFIAMYPYHSSVQIFWRRTFRRARFISFRVASTNEGIGFPTRCTPGPWSPHTGWAWLGSRKCFSPTLKGGSFIQSAIREPQRAESAFPQL